jgi:hypothetical protein
MTFRVGLWGRQLAPGLSVFAWLADLLYRLSCVMAVPEAGLAVSITQTHLIFTLF